MHFGFLEEYWWAVLVAMAAAMAAFVLIAGWRAGGGVKGGWEQWRSLSRKAAEFQARVILTVFFFTVGAPFGMVRTWLMDPLRLRPASQGRTWLARKSGDATLDDARRAY